MLRAFPWTVLALAPLTQARFGRLSPRESSNECCPCPAPGQLNHGDGVVTVTQPAQTVYVSQAPESPKHTVTIERTVTAEPHTVYVTQPNNTPSNAPSGGNEIVVTVSPQPPPPQQAGPKTVTVINGDSQAPQQQPQSPQSPQTVTVVNVNAQPEPVTKTVLPEDPKEASGPKTVTVNANQPIKMVTVVTVTQGGSSSQTQQQQPPSAVTVTASPAPPLADNIAAAQPEGPKTVVVTIKPDSPSAQAAAVTAPPQTQTIVQNVDHYSTLTKTVAGGGGDNIEIIIINIYTGETSCKKKHSGKSCHAGGHQYLPPAATGSSKIPCPSVNATTSVATAYNTVLVTLPPGNSTGAAQPTGSKRFEAVMGKKPRAPISMRKW